MKHLCYALFLASFFIIGGCSSDPCDEVVCQNGGTCLDGACSCPEGFKGQFCESIDYNFVGEYSSDVLIFQNCSNASLNQTLQARNNEFCIGATAGDRECLEFITTIRADGTFQITQISIEYKGGIVARRPFLYKGNYTVDENKIEMCDGMECFNMELNTTQDVLTWFWPEQVIGCDVEVKFLRD